MSRTSSHPQTLPPTRPEIAAAGPGTRPARWAELATSADHKDISRILIGSAIGSVFLAALELLLLRLQLAVPSNVFINGVTFDRLLSVYGETAIFLVALPLVIGLLYYVVPIQIGSRGTAIPRVGQIGLWLFIFGGFLLYGSFLFTPPEAGINPLPPFSETTFTPNNGVDVWIGSTGLITFGLLLVAIDLLTTLHNLRAPGMAWRRAPLFTWAGAIAGWLFAVIAPIFLAGVTMLMIDRTYDAGFFAGDEGGSPILWQHLSYIFFTGVYMAVSVSILAAIGEIVQTFAGRELPRKSFIRCLIAIAVIGTLAWTQNMLTAPIPSGWKYFGMLMALALIVPFGLIFFNLISTVSESDFHMRAPMRFALGALSLASIGLAAEIAQSTIAVAAQLSETYDAWAATHFTLIGFVIFGGFAAVTYWYPKLTGRQLNEARASKSFALMFVGTIIAVLPLFGAGVAGQVTDSYRWFSGEDYGVYNVISAIGTLILFLGLILAIGNLIRSRSEEPAAAPDPYRGDSLEWLALSPPPAHNFDVLPDVRSTRPMRDIREAVSRRDNDAALTKGAAEPVA